MPDRPDYFRCPLCRSVSCERLVIKRADGTTYVSPLYSCTVCTIVFRDPLALTRGYEDRPHSKSRSPSNAYQTWARINQERKDRE